MTVLALTRYGLLGPSTRVRFGQFVEPLAALGIEVEVMPLLGDEYVRRLYAGRPRSRRALVASYARRLRQSLGRRRADVVWVEKELLPYVPAWVEQLALVGRRVVLDYDDATFHTYDRHPRPTVRRLLGRKVDRLMTRADAVVAGNEYLADRARAAGATRVDIIPSVVDLDRYGPAAPEPEGPFTIGWIGSPGSEVLLGPFADVLAQATSAPDTRLILVGASERALPGVPHETWAWSEASEARALQAFHVGVMPLRDTPWERGKCGFKLIQYMAAGRPVVASPVGVNAKVVTDGETGFLAASPAEWGRALRVLHADPALRQSFGAAGRSRVEARYSVAVAVPALAGALRSVV